MSSAQTPDQLYQTEQEAIRLSEEIKAEYWAVSAKSGGRSAGRGHAPEPAPRTFTSSSPTDVPGDGVRDFFFRVASLTFEAIVLSELENSGSKHVSDIVSESGSQIKGSVYPQTAAAHQTKGVF